MKKFLYLVQCRKNLPESLNALHGSESDVIFLSWRKPTKKGIFFPFSTYNQGRNRLYLETADKEYLYYIFMDEDINLEKTSFCKNPDVNPWRVYEQYLCEYEPAVGVAWGSWQKRKEVEVEAIDFFDLMLNAIHNEAISALLPYDESFDAKSWWCSTLCFNYLAYLLYPGYILQFNALKAINLRHAPYPRGQLLWGQIDNDFKKSIINEELKKRFHPLWTKGEIHPVKRKDRTYIIGSEEMKRLFDFDNIYWKQRLKPLHAGCRGIKFSYFGEWVNKKLGSNIATVLFEAFLFLKELCRRVLFPPEEWDNHHSPIVNLLKKCFRILLNIARPFRHIFGLRSCQLKKFKEKIISKISHGKFKKTK